MRDEADLGILSAIYTGDENCYPRDMKIEELYQTVQSLWPNQIDISDAVVFGEKSGRFLELAKANDEVELAIETKLKCKDLQNLVAWSFYQEIHALALRCHKLGRKNIWSTDVTISMLDARIRTNLKPYDWEEIRVAYEAANPAHRR